MERKFDQNTLTLLLESRQLRELHDALAQAKPVDVARFLSDLDPEQAILAFRTLPKEQASEVFSELDADLQRDKIGRAHV